MRVVNQVVVDGKPFATEMLGTNKIKSERQPAAQGKCDQPGEEIEDVRVFRTDAPKKK